MSQLKKVERAEAQARDKEQRDKAKRYSKCIAGGHYLKQPKAVTLVETKKRKKSMKMGILRALTKRMNQTISWKVSTYKNRAHTALA